MLVACIDYNHKYFRYVISMEMLIIILPNKICKFTLNKKVSISIGFYLFSETYGLLQVAFYNAV